MVFPTNLLPIFYTRGTLLYVHKEACMFIAALYNSKKSGTIKQVLVVKKNK